MVIRGLFDGNLIGLVLQRAKESRKFSHFPTPIIIITISRSMTLSANVQPAAIQNHSYLMVLLCETILTHKQNPSSKSTRKIKPTPNPQFQSFNSYLFCICLYGNTHLSEMIPYFLCKSEFFFECVTEFFMRINLEIAILMKHLC